MKNDQLIPACKILPQAIFVTSCDLLPVNRVTYTYDLRNYRFYSHVLACSIMTPPDWRWTYLLDPDLPIGHFLACPAQWYAQDIRGVRVKYSIDHMLRSWDIIALHRNKLQSAWDRFDTCR